MSLSIHSGSFDQIFTGLEAGQQEAVVGRVDVQAQADAGKEERQRLDQAVTNR